MDDPQRGDDELAAQVAGGDEEALAALYHRYFGGVYDSTIRLSRDRDIAALVVQSSFLRVFQSLRAGGPQASFKLQLLAGAHHDVGERLRSRREPAPEAEEAFTVADPSRLAQPAAAGDLHELARTAWQAAGDLRLNDYELLDLTYRQRLNAGEVAQVLRTRTEAVSSKLTAVVDEFEKAFSARFLFSMGRRACLDLDFLVGSGEWSANLRRRIERHLETCQVCRDTRAQAPAASDLLASLLPVPAPEGWQQTILDRLRTGALAAGPAAPIAAAPAPPPSAAPPARAAEPLPERSFGGGGGSGLGEWLESVFGGGGVRGPLLAALLGGLLAVVIVVGALCGAGAFDGGDGGTPIATVTVTMTGTVTGTPTMTGTPSPTVSPTSPPQPTLAPTSTPAPRPTATAPQPTRRPTNTPRPTRTPPPPTQPPPATEAAP